MPVPSIPIYGLGQSEEEKKKIMNSKQKHEARNHVYSLISLALPPGCMHWCYPSPPGLAAVEER